MAQQLLVKQGLFSFEASRSHSVTHAIIGRTPLGEWSAPRRDLYLTTHNTQTSMPPGWFEPAIPAGKRPQTNDLDRAATGIGPFYIYIYIYIYVCVCVCVCLCVCVWVCVCVWQRGSSHGNKSFGHRWNFLPDVCMDASIQRTTRNKQQVRYIGLLNES